MAMLHLSINSASLLKDSNLSLLLMTIKLRFVVVVFLLHLAVPVTDSHFCLHSLHILADIFDELEQRQTQSIFGVTLIFTGFL